MTIRGDVPPAAAVGSLASRKEATAQVGALAGLFPLLRDGEYVEVVAIGVVGQGLEGVLHGGVAGFFDRELDREHHVVVIIDGELREVDLAVEAQEVPVQLAGVIVRPRRDHEGNDGEEDPVVGEPDVEAKAVHFAAEAGAPGVLVDPLDRPAVALQELFDAICIEHAKPRRIARVFLLVKDECGGSASGMKLLAAVIQMTSKDSLSANLARAAELIGEAAQRGASLVALPENFALFTADEAEKQRACELLDGRGRILTAMSAAARQHHVALVLGGMPELPVGGVAALGKPRAHNTCVYLDADGRMLAAYRKIHLFDVQLPDGASYAESDSVVPGEVPVVVDTPWGKLGLSVCYDVRFPELYRLLAEEGAQMLAVPAAFTQHTGRDHWHVLLRARAIENLCYVLAPAQYGRHTEKRTTYGHAMIIDPWGQILAEVGDHEGIAVAELDFFYQAKLRAELPALSHRRL